MTSKNLNHLRVVIRINDDESVNHNIRYFKANYLPAEDDSDELDFDELCKPPPIHNSSDCGDNMKAEVLLIDEKCLQLNLMSTEEDDGPYTNISHKMHFDYVSRCSISTIKRELAIIMNDLLLKQLNCSIIRFSNYSEADITIFFDLFITFLHKRIYHQKYKLQYVKLECLDIAATSGNSGTQPVESGIKFRASVAPESDDATFRLIKNSQNNFRNTSDLISWICNEYRYKFADHWGHEKLHFTFSILDNHQNVFKVNLSLFNIYMDLMKTEERNHWLTFMDHMGNGCQGQNCDFIHSGLTISLSSHIEGIASRNTLLTFDVPTDNRMTTDTIEMLQMAHAVVQNRKKKQIKIAVNPSNCRKTLQANDCSKKFLPSRVEELKNNLSESYQKERRSSLPSSEDQEDKKDRSDYMRCNINQLTDFKALVDNSYSSKDFNALSGWYRRIDERFARVCQIREKYYDRYFELKYNEIAANTKHIFNSVESLYTHNIERNPAELQENLIELHEIFEQYHNARTLFRQLMDSIQNSEFENILKIYLDTKMFESKKQALTLKRKHIELSEQHLTLVLNKLAGDLE